MGTSATYEWNTLQGVRAGIMAWHKDDELVLGLQADLEAIGCEASIFYHNETIPKDLDVVVVDGPYGSLVPLANQLVELSPSERPAFVFMMSEQLPNPTIPEWFRYWVGIVRSRVERWAYYRTESGAWHERRWMRWITSMGTRYRYYGDLYWFKRTGILSLLVLSSHWTANFLRERGFDSFVFPIGFIPDGWSDHEAKRDIPVLWLGKMGSKRRERLLTRIRAELEARGVPLMVIDGVEHPYVFGEERTKLLYRTKIVLNLLRQEWDDNSMRYVLSMPRKAMVVTEPTLPHTAFVPGEHLVEAPIDKISETICYYLEHEHERQKIAEQAYEEIIRHPHLPIMASIVERVLQKSGVEEQINATNANRNRATKA